MSNVNGDDIGKVWAQFDEALHTLLLRVPETGKEEMDSYPGQGNIIPSRRLIISTFRLRHSPATQGLFFGKEKILAEFLDGQ